jgi:hypothetical protein
MPRVRIRPGNGVDEEQLRALLEEAGCPAENSVSGNLEEDAIPVEAEEDADASSTDEECDPDALIVLLTPELAEDDLLESDLREAANRGCVVVGVWPPGVSAGVAPPPFKKYSSDQVIWAAEPIRRAICGEGSEPAYQDYTGAPQPAADTPRNCC